MMSKLKIFLIFFFLSLAVYANSLRGNFLYDDYHLLVDNEYIRQADTLPRLFTADALRFSFFSVGNAYNCYRPMSGLSYAADYALWKLNPFGYHLENILWHALNAFLVFYLIYLLFSSRRLAFLSGLLFCVHPAHTEVVNFITERMNLLVAFFTLLTLIFYLRYVQARKGGGFLCALFFFACALLTREAGFLLAVPVFVLFAGWRARIPWKTLLLHLAGFSGIAAIYVILRLTLLVPVELFPHSQFSLPVDILNLFNILSRYAGLFIFPWPLYVLRTIPPVTSFFSWPAVPPLLFALSLGAAFFLLIKRKMYISLFGLSWFILGAFYLLSCMYKFTGYVSMEEHWLYIPLLGLCLIAADLILRIKNRPAADLLVVFLVLAFGAVTAFNSRYWGGKREDFYQHQLRFADRGPASILRTNFVAELCREGNYTEALKQVKLILADDPESWMAYIELGDILEATKQYGPAIQAYQDALKIDYFCWQATLRLKSLLSRLGKEYKDETLSGLSPVESEAISFARAGDFDRALVVLEKELGKTPTPQLYTLAGIVLGKMGRYRVAEAALNAAIRMDSDYLPAWYNLAVVYEKKHDFKQAKEILKRIGQVK